MKQKGEIAWLWTGLNKCKKRSIVPTLTNMRQGQKMIFIIMITIITDETRPLLGVGLPQVTITTDPVRLAIIVSHQVIGLPCGRPFSVASIGTRSKSLSKITYQQVLNYSHNMVKLVFPFHLLVDRNLHKLIGKLKAKLRLKLRFNWYPCWTKYMF